MQVQFRTVLKRGCLHSSYNQESAPANVTIDTIENEKSTDSREKLNDYFNDIKKIINFYDNPATTAFEKVIFANFIRTEEDNNFRRAVHFYPKFISECDLRNTFWFFEIDYHENFWNSCEGQDQPYSDNNGNPLLQNMEEDIRTFTEMINKDFDSKDEVTRFYESFKEIYQKNNPYKELVFMNIKPVREILKNITDKLKQYQFGIHGEYKGGEEKRRYQKFADLLNKKSKPDGIKQEVWDELIKDPLVKLLHTRKIQFTYKDIQTAKKRIKEQVDKRFDLEDSGT